MKSGILLHGSTGHGQNRAAVPDVHAFRQPRKQIRTLGQYNELLNALRDFDSGKVRERVEMAKSVDVLGIPFGDPMAERSATDTPGAWYTKSSIIATAGTCPFRHVRTCRRRRWRRKFHDRTMSHQRRLRCHRRRWFNDGRVAAQQTEDGGVITMNVTAVTGEQP